MNLGPMGAVLAVLLPVIFTVTGVDVAIRWLWMIGASRETDE